MSELPRPHTPDDGARNDVGDPRGRDRPGREMNSRDPLGASADEAARRLAGARWRRMVVLGEGGTERRVEPVEGYEAATWYDRVTATLRAGEPGLACLNLLTGRSRRKVAVRASQLPDALAFGGDLALFQLVGFDLLRPSFDTGVFRTELVRIIAPLRERGYDVVLVEPFDLARSPDAQDLDAEEVRARQRAQAERTRSVAQLHGALHVDLTTLPAATDAGVWGTLGPAPNSRGHAVLAGAVVQALAAQLRPAKRSVQARGPAR